MAEAITAEKIISNAQGWTFEGDCALLQWMKQISENLEQRVNHTGKALNTLNANVKRTSIALDNAANSLNTLASLQFVESRVHEDDVTILKLKDTTEDKHTEEPKTSTEVLQQFLKNNLKMLHTCHDKYVVDFEDSDDEDNANNCIYQPKNPYNERLLPHIYGSKLWKETWHVGLCDTANDYSGDEVSETFSESSKSAAEDNESFESNTEENLSEWASSTSNLNDSKYATHIAVQNASSLRGSQPLFPEAISNVPTRALSSSAETNSSSPAAVGGPSTSKPRTYQHDLFATIQQETPPNLSSASSTKSSSEERNSRSLDDAAYEVHEPRFVQPAQVKRKPVNLFDDDDFNSFMTEIVDKVQQKTVVSPPPVPAQRKLTSQPEEAREEASTKSSKPVEEKALPTKEIRETSPRTSIQAVVISKTPVDLFDEIPKAEITKEKPTSPINISSKSTVPKTPLNLFDSPPDDDLFVPTTRKTEIYAAESSALPKTSITAHSLFDDDDDDDDFLNVFGAKKLTLPATYRKEPNLFDDDNESGRQKTELPKFTETRTALFDDHEVTSMPKTNQTKAALFDDENDDASHAAGTTSPKSLKASVEKATRKPLREGTVDQSTPKQPIAQSEKPLPKATNEPLFPPGNESYKAMTAPASTQPKLILSDLFEDMDEDDDLFSKKEPSKPIDQPVMVAQATPDLFDSEEQSDELFGKKEETEVKNSVMGQLEKVQTVPQTKAYMFSVGKDDIITERQNPEEALKSQKKVEGEVSTEQVTEEPTLVSRSPVNKLSASISSEHLQTTTNEPLAQSEQQPLKAPHEPLFPLGNKVNIAPASTQPKLILSDLFDDMEEDDDLFSNNSSKLTGEPAVVAQAKSGLFGTVQPTEELFVKNAQTKVENPLATKPPALSQTNQTVDKFFAEGKDDTSTECVKPEEARNPPNNVKGEVSSKQATQEPRLVSARPANALPSSERLQHTTNEPLVETENQPLKAPNDTLNNTPNDTLNDTLFPPVNEINKAITAPAPSQSKLIVSDLFDDADDDLFSKKESSKTIGKSVGGLASFDTDELFRKNSQTDVENSLTAAAQASKAEDLNVSTKQFSTFENENLAPAISEASENLTDEPPASTAHIIACETENPSTSSVASQHNNFEFDFARPENPSTAAVSTPKELAPNSQLYSGLFLDEPPDDDGFFQSLSSKHLSSSKLNLNLEQDFEEPNLPQVPFSSKEVEAAENSNYGGLHLFSEVPPDDDDFIANVILKGTASTKETSRVFYDDVNETLEAVKQSQAVTSGPLHGIFSDEPPSDEEIFGQNKTSEQSKDVTDRVLNIKSPKEATGAISKLQMPKININVQALLPNASGKAGFKKVSAEAEKISTIGDGAIVEPALVQHTLKAAPIEGVHEAATGASNRLSSACKQRVRVSVKRRPSTRHGRQENYRQSVLAAERQTLLTESVEEYLQDERIASGREQLIAKSRQSRVDDKLLANPYALPVPKMNTPAVGDPAFAGSPTASSKIEASGGKDLAPQSKSSVSTEIKSPASKFNLSDLFSDDDNDHEDSLFSTIVSQAITPKEEVQKEKVTVVEKPVTASSKQFSEDDQSAEDLSTRPAVFDVAIKLPASNVLIHDSASQIPNLAESLPKQSNETSNIKDDEAPHKVFKNATSTPQLETNDSPMPTKAFEKKSAFSDLFENDDDEVDDLLFKPKVEAAKMEKKLLGTQEKNATPKELSFETKANPKVMTGKALEELPEAENKPQSPILPSNTQAQLKTAEQPQHAVTAVKASQLFVDSFSDEDDLFSTNPPIVRSASYSTEAIKTATKKVISNAASHQTPPPATKHLEPAPKSSESKPSQVTRSKAAAKSLFGDEQSDDDEDDLFRALPAANKNPAKSKPVTMPVQKSLFGSENESDGDEFSKPPEEQQKPTQKIVKSLPAQAIKEEQPQQQAALKATKQTGKSLFSDIESEDDDDLFGGGAAKTGANKNTVKAATKKSTMAKAVRDPLLTGPQQASTAKLKPTTSTSTVADNPLADLLNN